MLDLSLSTYLWLWFCTLCEVALVPATGGIFTIDLVHSPATSSCEASPNEQASAQDAALKPQITRLWDQTKQLKQLVRNIIDPNRDLGHVDRHNAAKPTPLHSTGSFQSHLRPRPQDPPASSSMAQRVETVVADLMSSLPQSLVEDGEDDENPQQSSAEVSAVQKAEKMVAEIMSSAGGLGAKKDSTAEIGGGSGGFGTGQKSDDEDGGMERDGHDDKQEAAGDGEVGVHSARQGCEDCE
ncbi:MAG: hypothetical protein Q9170_000544 [Blastenia crenularia]